MSLNTRHIRAVLLLNVAPTFEDLIAEKLSKIPEVKDVMVTFGDFDVCAIVQAKNPSELGKLVTREIRKIEGVTRTSTLLEAHSPL